MQLFNTLFTIPLTAERHFCSIFKHKSFGDLRLARQQLSQISKDAVESAVSADFMDTRGPGCAEDSARYSHRVDTLLGSLFAAAWLHQPQAQHVKSGKERDHQQDLARLSMNKTHECLRARQQLRLMAISFVAKVRQDRTPERRTSNGHKTENSEIHLNDAGWDRDEVPNDRQALPFLPVKLTTSR